MAAAPDLSTRACEYLARAVDSAVAGELAEARSICREVLEADPANASALHVLSAVSAREGDLSAAAKMLRRAIELEPCNPAWLLDLAVLHYAGRDWPAALDALSRSLALERRNGVAWSLQGRALRESGEMEAAFGSFKRWSKLEPQAAGPRLEMARCLLKMNLLRHALRRAQRALELAPDSAEAHQLLAQIRLRQFEPEAALRHAREILRLLPENSGALALMAEAEYAAGNTEAAAGLFRRALPAGLPARMHAGFLVTLLHQPGSTGEEVLQAHREWARLHRSHPPSAPPFTAPPDPNRRLRVAYLCSEPTRSPLFQFLPPLLRNHDLERFAVSLYWRDRSFRGLPEPAEIGAVELSDVSLCGAEEIAERMRRDGIDILVDVSGHFGGDSLLVAARRAAPVQVSYPSYPSTTGIPEMDYIFTDRWTCAPGQKIQYSEKPYWLENGYLVYDPPVAAPPPGPLPARRNGYVTFGVFQRPAKLNACVWDAIAAILKRTGSSRLFVHHASADLDSEASSTRQSVRTALESRGVDPERVRFRGFAPTRTHLRLVSGVDIALDSFPYTGQTTTCECLWMGVPVVALAGSTHVARVSTGLLVRAGLGGTVASRIEEYVELAAAAAVDWNRLETLRRRLRGMMQASSLVNGAQLTREVEDGYRWMWRQHASRFR